MEGCVARATSEESGERNMLAADLRRGGASGWGSRATGKGRSVVRGGAGSKRVSGRGLTARPALAIVECRQGTTPPCKGRVPNSKVRGVGINFRIGANR